MPRIAANPQSHPTMRRLVLEGRVVAVIAAVAIGIAVATITVFVCSLFLADGANRASTIAQSLGNVVGGAAGAFGAYLVARWQFNADIRDRREDRAILAAATFNAVRDRYDVLEGFADLFEPLRTLGFDQFVTNVGALAPQALDFEILGLEPTLRAVISEQIPYESLAIYEMDHALARARDHIYASHRLAPPNGDRDSSRAQLEDGVGYLSEAAEQWLKMVEGLDLTVHLADKAYVLAGEAKSATELIERIEELRP